LLHQALASAAGLLVPNAERDRGAAAADGGSSACSRRHLGSGSCNSLVVQHRAIPSRAHPSPYACIKVHPLLHSPSPLAARPPSSRVRSHSDVHMVMVNCTLNSILVDAQLTVSSGGEHQDHVNRLQPVSFTPSVPLFLDSHLPLPPPSPTIPFQLKLDQLACSFVQDLSFRASLVCADQDAVGVHADPASGALGSGAAVKRKRTRTAGARDHPASSVAADAGVMAAGDGREKALDLKGSHFR